MCNNQIGGGGGVAMTPPPPHTHTSFLAGVYGEEYDTKPSIYYVSWCLLKIFTSLYRYISMCVYTLLDHQGKPASYLSGMLLPACSRLGTS